MKKTISVFLALLMLLCAVPVQAFASNETVVNITKEQMSSNAYAYVENALKEAKLSATSSKPYRIELPSGEYKLDKCLHIYSNTKLVLNDDTTLIKNFSSGNMIKLGVQEEVNDGYSGYHNVMISGGVWDADYRGSCIMRFAHCNNVTVKNAVMKNQKDEHFLELAAADNFIISKCQFLNYRKTKSATDGLAVQIDHMHSAYHFPSYAKYDDTPCKNITVENCVFDNIYSGVGSRSGVAGGYFTNIKIKNNTFSNVRNAAVRIINYRNSSITSNTINSATYGIVFENFPESNVSGRLFRPHSGKVRINNNTNTEIKDNKIEVVNHASSSKSSGILLRGGSLSSKNAKKYGLPAGGYYVQGLEASNNEIKVKSASSKGIYMLSANKNKIKSNTIKSYVLSKSNGISAYASSSNEFSDNSVSYFNYGVVTTGKSSKNVFSGNRIKHNNKYGIGIDKTSKAVINYGNSITKNKKGAVEINSKKYSANLKTPKIKAKKVKRNYNLSWKKTGGVSGYKIYRSKKKKSGYVLIKTQKDKSKTKYTDKKAKGKKYYYKIQTYRSVNGTKIYGKIA